MLYAKKKGFLITLFTNGTLITPDIADFLKKYPPLMVEITLNSLRQENYERISRVSNSFKSVKRGISLLLERKVPLTLKTVGITLNRDEILEIKRYVDSLDGINFKYDSVILAGIDGSKDPCRFRLTPEEIIDIETSDEEMKEVFRKTFEKKALPANSNYLYRCRGRNMDFLISPDGQLQYCYAVRTPSVDLKQPIKFKEKYKSLLSELFSMKFQTESPCEGCNILYLCQQCPGRALMENGDPESKVEYFCQLAHKRLEQKAKYF